MPKEAVNLFYDVKDTGSKFLQKIKRIKNPPLFNTGRRTTDPSGTYPTPNLLHTLWHAAVMALARIC